MVEAAAGVTITGMEELQRKLVALGANLTEELTKAGVKAMRMNVEAAAKEKAREHNDNGILTASINTQDVFENGASIIKTGSSEKHAVYLEYGTGLYATGPGGSQAKKIPWLWRVESRKWAAIFGIERGDSVIWYGSHPHPFLRPAFDENKDQVMDDVQADLKAAIARYSK